MAHPARRGRRRRVRRRRRDAQARRTSAPGPGATVVARSGWEWAAVEGAVELIGPDDPAPRVSTPSGCRLLLREVFVAAGGTHDDWDGYDAAMASERRVVVIVQPDRVYSNG